MFYNVFQILFNGWMFRNICYLLWISNYNPICQPLDRSHSHSAVQSIFMGYCFYVSKVIDFLDTLSFYARKTNKSVFFTFSITASCPSLASSVHTRRPHHSFIQHPGLLRLVFLVFNGRHRSPLPDASLVEGILDCVTDGAVCLHWSARIATVLSSTATSQSSTTGIAFFSR